jgi:hypothetical protein
VKRLRLRTSYRVATVDAIRCSTRCSHGDAMGQLCQEPLARGAEVAQEPVNCVGAARRRKIVEIVLDGDRVPVGLRDNGKRIVDGPLDCVAVGVALRSEAESSWGESASGTSASGTSASGGSASEVPPSEVPPSEVPPSAVSAGGVSVASVIRSPAIGSASSSSFSPAVAGAVAPEVSDEVSGEAAVTASSTGMSS